MLYNICRFQNHKEKRNIVKKVKAEISLVYLGKLPKACILFK